MKLVISNAAGINDPARFHRAISEAKKADVFLYQETKLKGAKITEVRLKHGYHEGVYMASHPEGSRRGVLTLFHPRLQVTHMEHIADHLGQYLINVVILSGHRMLIVNVYGDPDLDASSLATLERLHQDINHMLNQYDISSIMMGGDLDASSKGIFGACQTNSSKYFLVLDPHFVATTKIENIENEHLVKQGWASWVKLQDFSSSSFYNICLPQIKSMNK